jgi:DNA-binding Lrp family transcriptional regulator
VKRLRDAGLIEREIAVLNPERVAAVLGHGLEAVVEVSLDRQGSAEQEAFEERVIADDAVQQCYRVSPGPDFVLVVHARDMPDYLALAQRLFTSDANVRNVKAFFSLRRAKFAPRVPLQRA